MKTAFLFFLLGVLSGAAYGILKFIVFISKNNLIVQFILDLLYSLSVGFLFLFATNYYLYGEMRLYVCLIFALGMILERKTLGKLFAKLYFILYNVSINLIQRIKTTRFGKIIFK